MTLCKCWPTSFLTLFLPQGAGLSSKSAHRLKTKTFHLPQNISTAILKSTITDRGITATDWILVKSLSSAPETFIFKQHEHHLIDSCLLFLHEPIIVMNAMDSIVVIELIVPILATMSNDYVMYEEEFLHRNNLLNHGNLLLEDLCLMVSLIFLRIHPFCYKLLIYSLS